MRLRTKPTRIRKLDETPRRRFSLGKYLYIALLAAALIYVGGRVLRSWVYIEGLGQIEIARLNVQEMSDIRITRFMVREGQEVHKGDRLFTFVRGQAIDGDFIPQTRDQVALEREVMRLEGERADSESELRVRRIEREYYRRSLDEAERRRRNLERLAALKALPPEEIEAARRECEKLQLQLRTTEEEIRRQYTRMGIIRRSMPVQPAKVAQTVASDVFKSPFSGMVTRIYFNDHEVAMKGEQIMSIYQSSDIHIKAFFDLKNLNDLQVGQEVTILFPDGYECQGRIGRRYSAALAQPPEFQKKYEPTQRNVVVDIQPLQPQLIGSWEIDKMSVRLRLRKPVFRRPS